MRRIGVVLLVMAMGLVIASPVGAAKPDCNDDPSHPSCKDEPVDDQGGGITCAEHATWKGQENLITDVEDHYDHFDVELSGKNVRACIDVMSDEGVWTVDIELLAGAVRSIGLIPRDSVAPGDSCGGVILSRPDLPLSIDLPQVPPPDYDGPNPDIDGDGMIEGAYVNSCGVDFEELIDGTTYATVNDQIPSPLAFQASMAGSRDAHVILHVHVPAYTPPTP
jgi:hypothetical protein